MPALRACGVTEAPSSPQPQQAHTEDKKLMVSEALETTSSSSRLISVSTAVLFDLMSVLAQIFLVLNHHRRWLDLESCNGTEALPAHLTEYPCGEPVLTRVGFLTQNAATSFRALFSMPATEVWMPVLTTALSAHLVSLLVLPSDWYIQNARRPSVVAVSLIPKAFSLISLVLLPSAPPSSYLALYMQFEGFVAVWQQLVYNFPLGHGLLVLFAHCGLSLLLCGLVPTHLQLFNPMRVATQAVCGAMLASAVLLCQHVSLRWQTSAPASTPATPLSVKGQSAFDEDDFAGSTPTAASLPASSSFFAAANGGSSSSFGAATAVPNSDPVVVAASRTTGTPVKYHRKARSTLPAQQFSLKQPTGLNALTIVEGQVFAPSGADASMAYIMQMAAMGARNAQYVSRAPIRRVYMKIPFAEPDQLPVNFLDRLNSALSNGVDHMAVGVAARAGCIELVLDLMGMQGTDYAAAAAFDSAKQYLEHRVESRSSASAQRPDSSQGKDTDLNTESMQMQMLMLHSESEPSVWIDTLHLQPPPGAEVLTQACGRVWISRWDELACTWVPEKASIKPAEVPRINSMWPVCATSLPPFRTADAGTAGASVSLMLNMSNVQQAPVVSARCRGKFVPVTVLPSALEGGPVGTGVRPGSADRDSAFALEGGWGTVKKVAVPGMAGCEDGSTTLVAVEITAGLPRNGLVMVECKMGRLLSNWRPLVVTDDLRLSQELDSLVDDSGSGGYDELLTDLGLWLEYVDVLGLRSAPSQHSSRTTPRSTPPHSAASNIVACTGPNQLAEASSSAKAVGSCDFGADLLALYCTERYQQHMFGLGVSLVEFAVDRAWPHMASRIVEDLISAGHNWDEILERSGQGLTLLHRAVRSQSSEVVALVVGWGDKYGRPWNWEVQVEGHEEELQGVTPLHLAAALPDGGALAERILQEYETACALWVTARDARGCRPVDFASVASQGRLAPLLSRSCAAAGQSADMYILTSGAALQGKGTNSHTLGKGKSKATNDPGTDGRRQKPNADAAAADVGHQANTSSSPADQSGYVSFVGLRNLRLACVWEPLVVVTVLAFAGRMHREGRIQDTWPILLLCLPHLATCVLMASSREAYLKWRETLTASVIVARTLAKATPLLGLLLYPNSTRLCMTAGVDALVEGVIPAACEQVRWPLAAVLRLCEAIVTALLYTHMGVMCSLVKALAWSLAWNGCSALLSCALDSYHRNVYKAKTK